MKHLYRCGNCGKYTMSESCICGSIATIAKPLKYSPDDKFSSYRRKAKMAEYQAKGLI